MSTQAFQRARLRTARELARLSQVQLASEAGLTPAAISQFESGAARPSPETIAILGDVLNVPIAFFHEEIQESHDGFFRSLRRTSVADRRRARAIAYVAHDVAVRASAAGQFPATDVPMIPVSGLDAGRAEIERTAAQVRAQWGIAPGPAPDIAELLEAHGITVIRLPLGSSDVDAFSLPFADHPVVVLGTDKDDRARSRFDGAHELGHLVVHGEQIWGVKEVETQPHQFAAEFLPVSHKDRVRQRLATHRTRPPRPARTTDQAPRLSRLSRQCHRAGRPAPPGSLRAYKARQRPDEGKQIVAGGVGRTTGRQVRA